MAETSSGQSLEQWVCPNDRQLALRAKLGAGWSVHTNKISSFHKPGTLTAEEQEQIMAVVRRAERADDTEMERIGYHAKPKSNSVISIPQPAASGNRRLVDRVDNMKRNAMGNGSTQCILCGDEFGILGATPTYCDDCQKAVCSKCGIDTTNSSKHALWLCKICSENRELWKRSGAWFFKGIPKHTIPEKVSHSRNRKDMPSLQPVPIRSPVHNTQYNTWSRSNRALASSDEDSSDEGGGSSLMSKQRPNIENLDTCDDVGSIGACSLDTDTTGSITLTSSDSRSHGDGRSRDFEHHVEYTSPTSPISPTTTTASYPTTYTSNDNYCLLVKSQDQTDSKSLSSVKSSSSILKSEYGCLEFSLLYDSLHSILQCTIIKALSLKAMDSNGFSDPYVKLHLFPQAKKIIKQRSSTKTKTLNPTWNEIFSYKDFSKEDIATKLLRIQVLDEDLFSHDFIGECEITLSILTEGRTSHFFLPLHKKTIAPDSRSLVSLSSQYDDRGRINISLCYNPSKRNLVIGIHRCFNLRAMDSNGFSDPFVKLYLLPDKNKKTKNKTRIKRKTLNPVYNEEFIYLIHPNDLAFKSLSISVWDHDFGKNDFIGGIILGMNSTDDKLHHWRRMIDNFSKTTVESHALLDKTKESTDNISIKDH